MPAETSNDEQEERYGERNEQAHARSCNVRQVTRLLWGKGTLRKRLEVLHYGVFNVKRVNPAAEVSSSALLPHRSNTQSMPPEFANNIESR